MALREFRDADGQLWRVWEVHPDAAELLLGGAGRITATVFSRRAAVRERFLGGWLAFESEKEKRRLTPIPAGWAGLTDAQLDALRLEAVPQGEPTRRLIE